METFSALLTICAGNSPVPGEFPAQRPVTRSFDVFFDLRLNQRLSKQSWGYWFETLSRPLWRHCNAFCETYRTQGESCTPFTFAYVLSYYSTRQFHPKPVIVQFQNIWVMGHINQSWNFICPTQNKARHGRRNILFCCLDVLIRLPAGPFVSGVCPRVLECESWCQIYDTIRKDSGQHVGVCLRTYPWPLLIWNYKTQLFVS